ncbi:MAG: glycosyltransferase family 2 protein [Erysipelotrichaceae bacterium]|nr:glycosyltransferase family 2 protein [Erysipelotrichaceae bacterium]
MSLISVIVPVYKVEPYIHRSVDSILNQTFKDFELILVDDGSPDTCGSICDDYAEKYEFIQVIHRENGGLSAARNTGIDWVFQNSQSEYFCFIDSDDWVHPKHLELLYKGIVQYDANISQCLFFETDGTKDLPSVDEEMIPVSPDEAYLNYYNPHAWSKLYRRHCFEKLRYPDGKLFEDIAIWYKLLFPEEKIVIVNSPLYYYYFREGSIVNSNWTPAHLDQVFFWEEQMGFFDSYENRQVSKAANKRFLWVLSNHLNEIGKSSRITEKQKKFYLNTVRSKMNALINKNKADLKSEGVYRWYYDQANPRKAWCYWKLKGILNKFRRTK